MSGSAVPAPADDQHQRTFPWIHATVGVDGNFLQLDEAWQMALGWSSRELVGTMFIERVHPDDLETVIAAIHYLHGGGCATTFACRYRRKNGMYTWLTWYAALHPDQFVLNLTGQVSASP